MNNLRLEEMDTPMLRNEYRRLRDLTVRAIGYYTTGDFDRDVAEELKVRSLDATPRGYVTAAHHWYRHAMAEVASYEDFLLERRDDRNDHMGYDTLAEAVMDRMEA